MPLPSDDDTRLMKGTLSINSSTRLDILPSLDLFRPLCFRFSLEEINFG